MKADFQHVTPLVPKLKDYNVQSLHVNEVDWFFLNQPTHRPMTPNQNSIVTNPALLAEKNLRPLQLLRDSAPLLKPP